MNDDNRMMATRSGSTFGISADALKVLAMITMVIDHTGAVLFPDQLYLRLIGRIAFPIYMWLLVMGFYYTSSRKKYMLRMAVLAVLSEAPFDLALTGGLTARWQNIYFTLLLCLGMLSALEWLLGGGRKRPAADRSGTVQNPDITTRYIRRGVAAVLLVAVTMAAAEWLHFDYGCTGPVLAAMFYLNRRYGKPGLLPGFLFFCVSNFADPLLNGYPLWQSSTWRNALSTVEIECFGVMALPFIARCSGVRKWRKGKLFFYLFYPLHLLVLYGIRRLFL